MTTSFRIIAAFLITSFIFVSAFLASNYFNAQRLEEVRAIEERIATDILSLETQFDLLAELSCEDIEENPVLTGELAMLGERLDYMESARGTDDPEVERLKKSYTLLLIKDSILMGRISEECNTKPISLFYFYSNEAGECRECRRQGFVLTDLQQQYPSLRIYAFDYNLDLSALRTLIAIHNVQPMLPALMARGEVHYGFKRQHDILALLPALIEVADTSSSATSTDDAR